MTFMTVTETYLVLRLSMIQNFRLALTRAKKRWKVVRKFATPAMTAITTDQCQWVYLCETGSTYIV